MKIGDIEGKLKPFRHWLLVVAIFLVGFSATYLSHGPRLSDPDAWFQYKMADYVVQDGGIPEVYPLAYYPEGRKPWIQDTLFLPYFFAYTSKLASLFGIPMMKWAMLFPAVFQGVAAVALFLAVRELWDDRTALFSSLFYAFVPLALGRVYSGTIDKEVLYGAFAYSSFYFFLRSYKSGIYIDKPKSFIAPLLAGILYGFAYGNWTGGSYIPLVIGTAAVVHFAFRRDVELMKSILAIMVVGPVTMHLVQPVRFSFRYFLNNFAFLVPFAVSFLPLSSIIISEHFKKRGRNVHYLLVMSGLLVAIVALLYAGGEGHIVEDSLGLPLRMITQEESAQSDLYMATVAESQPSQFYGGGSTILQRLMNGDFFRELGMIFFALPVGVLLLLLRLRGNKDFATIFTLSWLFTGLIAAGQGLRYLFFLAPSATVVAGYSFARLYDAIKKRERDAHSIINSTSKKRVLQSAESRLTNITVAHLALVISLLLVTMSTLNTAVASRNFESDLPKPWYDATMWFKDNTPDDSVIFFWWDYGYYFQALSNKYTIADGGGNVIRNMNLANMFSSPEDEAMKYIKKYVNYERTPTYILVSYEEFGKSGAINRIAAGNPETGETKFDSDGKIKDGQIYILNFQVPRTGDAKKDEQNLANALSGNNPYQMPFSTYYIVNMGDSYIVWALVQFDQKGNYHPEWSEKLLVKLLPFNTGYAQGLKHFELVYQDQWNYILIYKVK